MRRAWPAVTPVGSVTVTEDDVAIIAQNDTPELIPTPANDGQVFADRTLPETAGSFGLELMTGLAFHEFYFQFGAAKEPHNTEMCSPHVRLMGDVAVLSYVRVNQRLQADGSPVSRSVEETRVWQKQNGQWKHVHFHRSLPTK